MNSILPLLAISDVVWAAIISDLFWLLIVFVAAFLFRRELRALLGSLARFEIAGAIVELKDRQSSFEYYGVFTRILMDILSDKDSAEDFYPLISDGSARQLARVIRQSEVKVPEDDQQIEILKNVALIVGRKKHTAEALRVFEALLRKTPDDKELLKSKARFLRESGTKKNIRRSKRIYDELLQKAQHQNDPGIYYGRAQTRCLLEEPNHLDDALKDLEDAVKRGHWPNMLTRSWVDALNPEKIEKLKVHLAEIEAAEKKEKG